MSESVKWSEGNQRALGCVLAELRLFLEAQTAAAKGAPGPAEADFAEVGKQMAAAEAALPAPSALARLTSIFGLSPFEARLLLLCAAIELDGSFAALCASAGGEGHSGVTYGLSLAALPGAHWDALAPNGPLRYWRLIEVGPGSALTVSPLRIDERILHFLTGTPAIDERLPLSSTILPEDLPLNDADRAMASSIAETWTSQMRSIVQVSARDREQQLAIVRLASELLDLDFEILPATAVPGAAREAQNLTRLWNREIALEDRVLVIECDEWGEGDRAIERSLAILLAEVQGPVAVCTRERQAFGSVETVLFEVPAATDESQKEAWRRALGDRFAPLEEEVELLAAQFRLNTTLIDAAASLVTRNGNTPPRHSGIALWEFCRRQARSRLDTLAERVAATAGWQDLILPEAQMAILREIVAQVRYRARVYGQWGFAGDGGRNQGITALFAGPSGTGKTFAAEVLASDVQLDLYRIDLSAVVSKYIGETEKNLRRVFDAAENGGAILLFDEADALFGKRSEVKDSHDRYANIEVSYLLQRMEAYRGLAILTTNMRQALDPAFLRRLRFVVDFPFPGPEERAGIWRRSIPAAAPTEGIDIAKLSRVAMTGGNIRNICLAAAFAAAADGGTIGMKHLLHGARAESMKLERALSEADTRDWC